MLLDEPLSNRDANLREEMRFEIRRLHDQYRYTLETSDGSSLRVVTSTDTAVPRGAEVWLTLPAARSRALER